MFCIKCGAENASDSRFCINCGNTLVQPAARPADEVLQEAAPVVVETPVVPVYQQPAVTQQTYQQYAAANPSVRTEPQGSTSRVFLIIMSIVVLCSAMVTFTKLCYDIERMDHVYSDSAALLAFTSIYGFAYMTIQILSGIFGLIPGKAGVAKGFSGALLPLSIASILTCILAFCGGERSLSDDEVVAYIFLGLWLFGPIKLVVAILFRAAASNTIDKQ